MKLLVYLILLLNIFETNAQSVYSRNKFTLTGQIKGQDSGIIRLEYVNQDGKYSVDSCKINNGLFSFTGFIKHPVSADISGAIKSKSTNDFNTTNIFLEPVTMNISLEYDNFKHAIINGSESQKEIESIYRHNPFQIQMDSLEKEYILAYNRFRANRNNQELKKKAADIRDRLDPYYLILREKTKYFIKAHPDSYVSAYLFQSFVDRLPLDSAKLMFNRFTSRIQNSKYGLAITDNLRQIEGGMPGSIAKDFTAKDINGVTFSLSDYRDKRLVLLDFWATWCVPCRENNPFLVKLYNTYHEKGLEIIGIANNDNKKEEWRKAIKDDGIDIWRHILQRVGSKDDIGKLFGITPIPAMILIDTKGIIILRYEGNNDRLLQKTVEQLLGKN